MFCNDETGILGFRIIQKYMACVHSSSQQISIHQTPTPSLSPAGANPIGHTARGGTIPWTSWFNLWTRLTYYSLSSHKNPMAVTDSLSTLNGSCCVFRYVVSSHEWQHSRDSIKILYVSVRC